MMARHLALGIVFSVALSCSLAVASTPSPTPQNTLPDAAALLQNYDDLVTIDQQIASDRAAMATALSSNGNLSDAVKLFFHDRDKAATIDSNFITDRVRLRRDIGYVPTKLFKAGRAQGLSTDAANYIKDFDARSTAFNSVAADLANMRIALANSNVAAVTTDANAFFVDRHNLVQFHIFEGGDIGALRKDLRFHGTGKVSRPHHTSLSDNVRKYLNDRQAWLDAGTRVAADRQAIRAGLNSASLEALVQQFLTDHHQLFLLQTQLSIDRDILRINVGFKLLRRAQDFFGSIVGVSSSKEEAVGNEDIDQDVSIDNVGDK